MARNALHALTIIWFLLSAIMPGAVAVLDAEVEAAALSVQAHVEQEGGAGCPDAHDPDCAVCTTLRAGRGHLPTPVTLPAATRVARGLPLHRAFGFRSAEPRGEVQPRAPPAVI